VLRGDPAALKIARASDLPSILHLDMPVFPLSNARRYMRSVAARWRTISSGKDYAGVARSPKWSARGCRIYVVTEQQRVTH